MNVVECLVLGIAVAFASPLVAQENVGERHPAKTIAAATLGTTLGLVGVPLGFVVAGDRGAFVGGALGVGVGSFVMLRTVAGVEENAALTAVMSGLLAGGAVALFIDRHADMSDGGGIWIVVPITHAAVSGIVGSIWN